MISPTSTTEQGMRKLALGFLVGIGMALLSHEAKAQYRTAHCHLDYAEVKDMTEQELREAYCATGHMGKALNQSAEKATAAGIPEQSMLMLDETMACYRQGKTIQRVLEHKHLMTTFKCPPLSK